MGKGTTSRVRTVSSIARALLCPSRGSSRGALYFSDYRASAARVTNCVSVKAEGGRRSSIHFSRGRFDAIYIMYSNVNNLSNNRHTDTLTTRKVARRLLRGTRTASVSARVNHTTLELGRGIGSVHSDRGHGVRTKAALATMFVQGKRLF